MSESANNDRRPLAIGLCAAAAVCLLYAAFTETWLVRGSGSFELGFGLRGNHECATVASGTTCVELSNSELIEKWRAMTGDKSVSGGFVPAGWVTFIALVIAALGLAASAALGAMKKLVTRPIAPTSVALLGVMIGLVGGCVFVATKPGPGGLIGVGLSFWMFGIGSVLGIAGAQMMAKVNHALEPDWTVDRAKTVSTDCNQRGSC